MIGGGSSIKNGFYWVFGNNDIWRFVALDTTQIGKKKETQDEEDKRKAQSGDDEKNQMGSASDERCPRASC